MRELQLSPTVASFFSGGGGLDKGFELAGFETVWANEYDRKIAATFSANFPKTELAVKSITDVRPTDVPEVDGFIGGPPCQSWSEAGARRGIDDPRGKLFHTYRELLDHVRPKFFLAENVSGFLFDRNKSAREEILQGFAESGYNVSYGLLSASDYGVAQDRDRVIIVGFRVDTEAKFEPPAIQSSKMTIEAALAPLAGIEAIPLKYSQRSFEESAPIEGHHYLDSDHFSYIYKSRNRVRSWLEQSFTIQASGSHAPLHPSAPKMLRTQDPDVFEFVPGAKYRRLSIRECALIQSFPLDYKIVYDNVNLGYKVIGNAVPVKFAEAIGNQIRQTLGDRIRDLPRSFRSRKIGVITKY